ncbi:DUF1002 domain-containing protein [Caldisalinibacter kiritimatiensis]|uniref:DUF1002 domain-containing protein n=1 Tax=Caldisalinibacter kiritimatiensis TaxID=1304284 RepID=UPI0004B049FE|nr:DUF1002 domain-containing protein [Caldisalinibacter kiritimatiensis]
MINKRSLYFFMIFMILFTTYNYCQENNVTVSLGEDLALQQRQQMLDLFNVDDKVRRVEVTNEEEREYLGKYIKEEYIGTKAISCAYVEKLDNNEGITVETYNINWVTKEMYMNALVTAGVKDAKVKVAAPVSVSGTAALTGIIKAFEDVSGVNVSNKEKEVANEEIAKTGKLGEEIGKQNASQLIKEVKEEVASKNLKNEEEIREIVIKVAGQLDINLNSQQIDEIVILMKKVSELNLEIGEIKTQLKNISDKLNEISENSKEVKSLLQRIIDFLNRLFDNISTLVKNIIEG